MKVVFICEKNRILEVNENTEVACGKCPHAEMDEYISSIRMNRQGREREAATEEFFCLPAKLVRQKVSISSSVRPFVSGTK